MRCLLYTNYNTPEQAKNDSQHAMKKELHNHLFFACGLPKDEGNKCDQCISADTTGLQGVELCKKYMNLTVKKKRALNKAARATSYGIANEKKNSRL